MPESTQAAVVVAPQFETSVLKVLLSLLRHPFQSLILRWNWKAAVLSALLRAPIFFFTYVFKKDGLRLAIGA
ncbi:MAG TPA: hypothetical protein PLP07_13835, partial [Pyrinomonadaceae bacterium]|nr:hypothetical protein [Pyrinomonadaceae bacterium]